MVMDKLPVPGRPTFWITVGQRPTALSVDAGGVVWTFYSHLSFFLLSPSLWETARFRLKYCLKGPLNPKPTNNQTNPIFVANVQRLGRGKKKSSAPTASTAGTCLLSISETLSVALCLH